MSRPPYPHRCIGAPSDGTDFFDWTCQCGALPDVYGVATARDGWGCDCPIALRERIADLESAARADQSLRSVAAHAAGMQPASADDPEWPPRWEAIASGRISKAEAERDATKLRLAAIIPAHEIAAAYGARDDETPDDWATRVVAERDAARGLLESLPTWGAYGWREAADSVRAKLAENAKQIVDLMRERDEMAAAGRTVVECAEEQWRKVESELDEARRLRDLVRHQRGPLHDADLLTDAEYAALAADAGAVARLQGYDEVRRELAEAADPDNRHRAMLDWRGVSVPCPRCAGSGRCGYANTSTWRGGPGGQMLTDDVCDACWGSGDAERHGADLRALHAHSASIHKGVADALEARAKEVANDRAFGSGNELRARLAARDGWAGGLREAARIVRGA